MKRYLWLVTLVASLPAASGVILERRQSPRRRPTSAAQDLSANADAFPDSSGNVSSLLERRREAEGGAGAAESDSDVEGSINGTGSFDGAGTDRIEADVDLDINAFSSLTSSFGSIISLRNRVAGKLKDQQDNLLIWMLLFVALFFYCAIFRSAYLAEHPLKGEMDPAPQARLGPMGGLQKRSPAAARHVEEALKVQLPALSAALVARQNIWPLSVPLAPMHDSSTWCVDVGSAAGGPVLKARVRKDRERILEILQAEAPGQQLAVVTRSMQVLLPGGHAFGQLVEMMPEEQNALRFELREVKNKAVRIAVEVDPSGQRFNFRHTSAPAMQQQMQPGFVANAGAGAAAAQKTPPVATAQRRSGSQSQGEFLELDTVNAGVDPVLILACALAVIVFTRPK